jgi:hypothetical protein
MVWNRHIRGTRGGDASGLAVSRKAARRGSVSFEWKARRGLEGREVGGVWCRDDGAQPPLSGHAVRGARAVGLPPGQVTGTGVETLEDFAWRR